MRNWLRFRDLQARKIVRNWPQLKNLQKKRGFPLGRMIGPNTRGWTEEEIEAYEESCPVEGPEPRGTAKARKAEAAAKAAAETEAETSPTL